MEHTENLGLYMTNANGCGLSAHDLCKNRKITILSFIDVCPSQRHCKLFEGFQ